ncbi:hypothetical protein PMIN06_009689 [Paraphaeosphaeria minitans]
MAPTIFLTGGTGYIGGSVLHALVTAHPEYDITVLLRKTPEAFTSAYPNVKIVQGNYDSAETLAEHAKQADVVVHNGDSDHEPSLNALISGLLSKSTKSHLLHLSGTGIISDWASPEHLGTRNPKVYSDVDDIAAIAALPDHALHRNTEKTLFQTAASMVRKLESRSFYGPGAGPGNTQSAFTRFFIADATTLAGNRVFYTGAGTNTRFWVHISDLTSLYVRVVEAALADAPTFSGPGKYPGYYFASTQEHAHVDVARAIGEVLVTKGVIADAEPVEVGLDVVDRMAQHPSFSQFGRYMYAANARTRAVRAEKAFGYAGRAEGLLASQEVEVVAALGR